MKKIITTNKNKTISEIYEFESSDQKNTKLKKLSDNDLEAMSKRVLGSFKKRKGSEEW